MFSMSSLGRSSRDTGIVVVIVLMERPAVGGLRRRSEAGYARVTYPRDCQSALPPHANMTPPRVSESHQMTQAYAAQGKDYNSRIVMHGARRQHLPDHRIAPARRRMSHDV